MAGYLRGVILCAVLVLAVSCAPTPDPSAPGQTRGAVPDLRGRRVLVLPVQLRGGVAPVVTIDEELAYALTARSNRVTWVFGPQVEEILHRSPGVEAGVRNLPVGMFLQAEVKRVGDPLYGQIRRLTTLVDADLVVIPVQVDYGVDGAFHLLGTLIDPVSGRVLWTSSIAGEAGAPDSPGALASVADAFSRALVPLG